MKKANKKLIEMTPQTRRLTIAFGVDNRSFRVMSAAPVGSKTKQPPNRAV
jgi:hypothetical protein